MPVQHPFRLSPLSPFETSKLVLNRASIFNSMPKKVNLAPRRHPGRAAWRWEKTSAGARSRVRCRFGPASLKISTPPGRLNCTPPYLVPSARLALEQQFAKCGNGALAASGYLVNAKIVRVKGFELGDCTQDIFWDWKRRLSIHTQEVRPGRATTSRTPGRRMCNSWRCSRPRTIRRCRHRTG